MSDSHPLETLASKNAYRIQYCPRCDALHLQIGPVTMRLKGKSLDDLVEVVGRAAAQMELRNLKQAKGGVIKASDLPS